MLVHVFPGPTPRDVVKQISEHLGRLEKMPPLWATGYHVCRDIGDPDYFVESLANMTMPDNSTVQRVPFDSDCIDEMLYPTAFQLNSDFYAVSDMIQNLTDSGKKFVLTQHVQVDSADEGLSENVAFIKILNFTTDGNETTVGLTDFMGTFNGKDGVVLPDFTNASTSDWWADQVTTLLGDVTGIAGMTFAHNSPFVKLYYTGCSFTGISYVPEDIKSVFGLDTVCPEAVHSNGKSHLTMHNSYPGHQGRNLIETISA